MVSARHAVALPPAHPGGGGVSQRCRRRFTTPRAGSRRLVGSSTTASPAVWCEDPAATRSRFLPFVTCRPFSHCPAGVWPPRRTGQGHAVSPREGGRPPVPPEPATPTVLRGEQGLGGRRGRAHHQAIQPDQRIDRCMRRHASRERTHHRKCIPCAGGRNDLPTAASKKTTPQQRYTDLDRTACDRIQKKTRAICIQSREGRHSRSVSRSQERGKDTPSVGRSPRCTPNTHTRRRQTNRNHTRMHKKITRGEKKKQSKETARGRWSHSHPLSRGQEIGGVRSRRTSPYAWDTEWHRE